MKKYSETGLTDDLERVKIERDYSVDGWQRICEAWRNRIETESKKQEIFKE